MTRHAHGPICSSFWHLSFRSAKIVAAIIRHGLRRLTPKIILRFFLCHSNLPLLPICLDMTIQGRRRLRLRPVGAPSFPRLYSIRPWTGDLVMRRCVAFFAAALVLCGLTARADYLYVKIDLS